MAIDLTGVCKRYPGQWVGLADDERTVVANGKTVREVLDRAAQKGHKKPILFRVPTEIVPYIGGFARG